MNRRALFAFLAVLSVSLPAWIAACGGDDSAAPAAIEAGAPETAEPIDAGEEADAPVPLGPLQVLSAGGAVLAHPRVVPIIFEGDPQTAALEQFMQDLAASTYWYDVTAEYGVGPITFASPIIAPLSELPTAPIGYADIDAYVAAHVTSPDGGIPDGGADASPDGGDGGAASWGSSNDRNTIYTIFYPESVSLVDNGSTSCGSLGGFHSETLGVAPYAVVFACPHFGDLSEIDMVTTAASHEWVEAATNPQPYTGPAFSLTDVDHAEWLLYTGVAEIGDLCVLDSTADYVPTGFHNKVQRMWSNASAKAGHNPCVPRDDTIPYFVAIPEFLEKVSIVTDLPKVKTTRGLQVKVGETKTAVIDLRSDEAMPAWTVRGFDSVDLYGGTPELKIAIAPGTGMNGAALEMTITRISNGKFGGSLVYVSSQSGPSFRYWLSFVAN
jgi:hypothetical protein